LPYMKNVLTETLWLTQYIMTLINFF
jgi:hypothetical protein